MGRNIFGANPIPSFDTLYFLQHYFNNAPGLVAFVTAFGYTPPGLPAAEKWFQRKSIPSDWLPLLLALLELDTGAPIGLAGFLKSGESLHNE